MKFIKNKKLLSFILQHKQLPTMSSFIYFISQTNTAWKCPNTEFFLVLIFPHLDWIRRDTKYLFVFSSNARKYGPEKTRYLDTFHAVLDYPYSLFDFQKIDCVKALEALSQCLYGCIRYCWLWVKQFSISDIASNNKFKKLFTS